MKVKWQREVFGRQAGQVEEIDPKKEPRLNLWLTCGVAVQVAGKKPAAFTRKIANEPLKGDKRDDRNG